MSIAIAIILGVIAITAISAGFDYLGKRNKGASGDLSKKIDGLENRIRLLESSAALKEEEIRQLENKIEFMDRLLEDKTKNKQPIP